MAINFQKNTDTIIDEINKEGFSILKNPFSIDEIELIDQDVRDIIENYSNDENTKKNNFFKISKNGIGKYQSNLLGHSRKLDRLIIDFLDNEKVNELLDQVLGENRKLNTISIRKADSETSYDGIHTDHPAMMTISILANNHTPLSPATCIIPKSHISSFLLSDKIEKFPTNFLSFFYKAFLGDTGDIIFFLNRAWHGMKKGKGNSNIILISFIAEGHVNDNRIQLPEKTLYNLSFEDTIFKNFKKWTIPNFKSNDFNKKKEILINRIIFNQLYAKFSLRDLSFYVLGYFLEVLSFFKKLLNLKNK